jgi:hypothetical protein
MPTDMINMYFKFGVDQRFLKLRNIATRPPRLDHYKISLPKSIEIGDIILLTSVCARPLFVFIVLVDLELDIFFFCTIFSVLRS